MEISPAKPTPLWNDKRPDTLVPSGKRGSTLQWPSTGIEGLMMKTSIYLASSLSPFLLRILLWPVFQSKPPATLTLCLAWQATLGSLGWPPPTQAPLLSRSSSPPSHPHPQPHPKTLLP